MEIGNEVHQLILLRMSTLCMGRLFTQALIELSSHTSSCLISSVRPKVRPAASTKASALARFLMVAYTAKVKTFSLTSN